MKNEIEKITWFFFVWSFIIFCFRRQMNSFPSKCAQPSKHTQELNKKKLIDSWCGENIARVISVRMRQLVSPLETIELQMATASARMQESMKFQTDSKCVHFLSFSRGKTQWKMCIKTCVKYLPEINYCLMNTFFSMRKSFNLYAFD